MRKREEIEKLTQEGAINEYINSRVTVELLLDIRELLAHPPEKELTYVGPSSETIPCKIPPLYKPKVTPHKAI